MEKNRIPKEPKTARIGRERVTRAAAISRQEEMYRENEQRKFWAAITFKQNAQIAHEMRKQGPLSFEEAKDWMNANPVRMEAWMAKSFRQLRTI